MCRASVGSRGFRFDVQKCNVVLYGAGISDVDEEVITRVGTYLRTKWALVLRACGTTSQFSCSVP